MSKYKVNLSAPALDYLYKLITHYEGLHDGDLHTLGLQPKMCPAGYWTEGYGQLVLDDKGKRISGAANRARAVHFSKIKTIDQALEVLDKSLYARQVALEKHLSKHNIKLDDFQKAALISFIYNVGMGAFLGSGLWQAIINTMPRSVIDERFRAWNKGGGKVLSGLDKRRFTESFLYLCRELKL